MSTSRLPATRLQRKRDADYRRMQASGSAPVQDNSALTAVLLAAAIQQPSYSSSSSDSSSSSSSSDSGGSFDTGGSF